MCIVRPTKWWRWGSETRVSFPTWMWYQCTGSILPGRIGGKHTPNFGLDVFNSAELRL